MMQPQEPQPQYDDVQTGVLTNDQYDWQFDPYNQGYQQPQSQDGYPQQQDMNYQQPQSQEMSYQQPQFQYDIYGIGPVQSDARWDVQMAFIGIGQDCFRILIGIADKDDYSFVSMEKWYQAIPQGMTAEDAYLQSVENIISVMYNNIMLLGTEKMRTEWQTPPQ